MALNVSMRFESRMAGLSGGSWILLSGVLFSAMLAVFKLIGQALPVVEILFLRQLMVLAVIVPGFVRAWPESAGALRSKAPKLQILRTLLSAAAMLTGFTGLVHLQLAESTTLTFTRVIFAVLLSAPLLGEVIGVRRWSATAIGFVGVLIVSAPSASQAWNPYTLLALLAALFTGSVTVVLRRLATIDGSRTIMVWHSTGLLLLAVPCGLSWQAPTLAQWGLIGGLGLLMAGTQWTSIRALKLSEASAVAPFEYMRLIWAALFGYLVFDNIPDTRLAVGAVFVLAAAALAGRASSARTPRSPATPAPDTPASDTPAARTAAGR